MVRKYIKKPVIVEAIQVKNSPDNLDEIIKFVPKKFLGTVVIEDDKFWGLFLKTLNGFVFVEPEEYIIKGVNGEFYPCTNDIFKKTYDTIS